MILFTHEPTNLALAFANDPPMKWVWRDEQFIFSTQFASTVQSQVEIQSLPTLFVSQIQVGDIVFVGLFGLVKVVSKTATTIVVDFDATSYTPADTMLRLMLIVEVTLTVAGVVTPFRVTPNNQGVYEISAMELVRRYFSYPIPTEAEQTRVTYKSSLTATTYTALRSATLPLPVPVSTVFGQWPFRSLLTDGLNEAQPYLYFPVSSATGGTVDNQNIIISTGATTILAQPGTPVVLRMLNQNLATEPTNLPFWAQIQQDGNDVIITGTIPMNSPSDYTVTYAEGNDNYDVTIDVPKTLTPDSCIDGRFGVAWLGQNGQFKTYYFNRAYTETFAEVNGGLTRTGNAQRWVGLDELREGVIVREEPLSNELLEWLKDFIFSPVFFALDSDNNFTRRMYLQPTARPFRTLPKRASRNGIEFTLIYSIKTPTIYEG